MALQRAEKDQSLFRLIQGGGQLDSYHAVDHATTLSSIDEITSMSALEYALIHNRTDVVLYLQRIAEAGDLAVDAGSVAVPSQSRSKHLLHRMRHAQEAVKNMLNSNDAFSDDLKTRWDTWERLLRRWYHTLHITPAYAKSPDCHVHVLGNTTIGVHFVHVPEGTTYVRIEVWVGRADERAASYAKSVANDTLATRIVSCGRPRHVITDLLSGETYHVQVQGYNPHGFGKSTATHSPCVHLSDERLHGVRSKEYTEFDHTVRDVQAQVSAVHEGRFDVKNAKPRLKKNLRKGLYVSALLSRQLPSQTLPAGDERLQSSGFDPSSTQILMHNTAYLPTVSVGYVSNDYSAECMRDASWITRCCADWCALPTFPSAVQVVPSSAAAAEIADTPTLRLRRALIEALKSLNSLLGTTELGSYWGTPIVVEQSRATVLLFGCLCHKLTRVPRGLTWIDYEKAQAHVARPPPSTDDKCYPTAVMRAIPDVLQWQHSRRRLPPGLYVGAVLATSTLAGIYLHVERNGQGMFPVQPVRTTTAVSQCDWTELFSTPGFQHNDLRAAVSEGFRLLFKRLDIGNGQTWRLYEHALTLGDDTVVILAMPPSGEFLSETCATISDVVVPADGATAGSNTIPVLREVLESRLWAAHLPEYKAFCKLFCQLDCDSIVAHRQRRAAIGGAEVNAADAALAQCVPALEKLTKVWDDVQFVQQLIRWARQESAAKSVTTIGDLTATGTTATIGRTVPRRRLPSRPSQRRKHVGSVAQAHTMIPETRRVRPAGITSTPRTGVVFLYEQLHAHPGVEFLHIIERVSPTTTLHALVDTGCLSFLDDRSDYTCSLRQHGEASGDGGTSRELRLDICPRYLQHRHVHQSTEGTYRIVLST
eukprot:m.319783 g.319783  ORF g.319783 m.319783 type:complete len:877 (+) comp20306_c0_seq7:62-2692(+)